ncbi:RNA recognition motif domain-containing protein [Hirsutella rhossiliensis]|uniref:RNA recognition motif domain-containing protein n=1 Tax=Hirsutella rhossiliensis TaxID=111463 RepID=A0A9P8SG36_9HYPO|nr:RNA recognition motif domain-containing protein [Hirsutella rhossiliensis]KAH0961563.1 RNA recognition motif domain-containing protein [Hirsutella rhossiliensis]
MANKSTVHVKNIDGSTTDSEVKDFFSFCGKIADFQVSSSGNTKTADVTFEKETAMKTALLLNNTKLGPNEIAVTSASGVTDDDASHYAKNTERESDEITQEEKPRARILAEYLAHGYVVGDVAINRAIELDQKHGVSSRFVTTLQNLDKKYHASDRAKATDQSYGITKRANTFLTGISTYFEKASNTPTGKKIVNFYTNGSRQVQDIHAEAQRLAELKKEEHGGSAYKAAGLERVFGKEKEKTANAGQESSTTGEPATGNMNPAPINPTDPVPGVKAVDEKTG